jgi:hypothetical protein
VTARSIFNWIKRKEQRRLAPNKIKGEKLKAYLQENPDSYLKEIAEYFE